MEGRRCCGIYDINDHFEPMDNYTSLYPLKNGMLLATEDADAPVTFNFNEYEGLSLNKANVTGKIIDENGSTVFEYDDGLARMVPAGNKAV